MNKKSRLFLGIACVAMLVALTRAIPAISVGDGVGDFSTGLAAAMMFGVLVTSRGHRT